MIYSKKSAHRIEEIEPRLREAAQRHKFGVLHILDIRQTLQGKGIELGKECRIFDVCNPQAAQKALTGNMKASTVLPCRISVYGEVDGCTISTVHPTDLMRATGLAGIEDLANEVEREMIAIIDETA